MVCQFTVFMHDPPPRRVSWGNIPPTEYLGADFEIYRNVSCKTEQNCAFTKKGASIPELRDSFCRCEPAPGAEVQNLPRVVLAARQPGSACPGYPRGVWPPLLSAFCADASPTNQRHPDCSVPGCICPCHSRRSPATWKLEARGVVPSNNGDDFSPQAESVGLMEKLERLGGNRHSTRVFSR